MSSDSSAGGSSGSLRWLSRRGRGARRTDATSRTSRASALSLKPPRSLHPGQSSSAGRPPPPPACPRRTRSGATTSSRGWGSSCTFPRPRRTSTSARKSQRRSRRTKSHAGWACGRRSGRMSTGPRSRRPQLPRTRTGRSLKPFRRGSQSGSRQKTSWLSGSASTPTTSSPTTSSTPSSPPLLPPASRGRYRGASLIRKRPYRLCPRIDEGSDGVV
mmetsp:Transcript_66821/g.153232  ORF Transcript_66821/g.153232 Transcript_66821/m.153232 type:complete len:216 (+) Transcript_66821:1341-1988(+)